MAVTLDLPEEVVARLRSEADRRGLTFDQLIIEMAESLTSRPDGEVAPRVAFVASGASASGVTDKIDELLSDGFGRS